MKRNNLLGLAALAGLGAATGGFGLLGSGGILGGIFGAAAPEVAAGGLGAVTAADIGAELAGLGGMGAVGAADVAPFAAETFPYGAMPAEGLLPGMPADPLQLLDGPSEIGMQKAPWNSVGSALANGDIPAAGDMVWKNYLAFGQDPKAKAAMQLMRLGGAPAQPTRVASSGWRPQPQETTSFSRQDQQDPRKQRRGLAALLG